MFLEMLVPSDEQIDSIVIDFISRYQEQPEIETELGLSLVEIKDGNRVYAFEQRRRSGITQKTFIVSDFKVLEIHNEKEKNLDKIWNKFMCAKLRQIKPGLDKFYVKEMVSGNKIVEITPEMF